MKSFFLMVAMVTSLTISGAATMPVRAGGGDVAAGLIGGLAAGTIIGAAVVNAGQTCIEPDYLMVHADDVAPFVAAVSNAGFPSLE